MAVAWLCNQLIDARQRNVIPPLVFIVEEAQICSPEGQNVLSRPALIQLANVGRKLGIGVCFVTQRPSLLAAGMTVEEILKEYPELTAEDVRAALKYASDVLRREVVLPLEA